MSVFELRGELQSYDWGEVLASRCRLTTDRQNWHGVRSGAARCLCRQRRESRKRQAVCRGNVFKNKSEKELKTKLWMGTHASAPSKRKDTGQTLQDALNEDGNLLSSSVSSKFGRSLPFLFKILSIRKALSLQAHPDKKLAEKIHSEDPKNYKGWSTSSSIVELTQSKMTTTSLK